ncbi:MAG: T9SS type A sorting domain-containing protein [Phaeodactylibacter sp.]|nr:T9SS type A sorting domain-containing protein [Phaeodactylibacter sp.]
MKKLFLSMLILAGPFWLSAQPCTDNNPPNVICKSPIPIDIGGTPADAQAFLFVDDVIESVSDDCGVDYLSITRDNPDPGVTDEILIFTCDDEGLSIPVFPTATDFSGKSGYCLTYILVQDPTGLCPAGTFTNESTGETFPSAQSAILLAQEGALISVLAEEPLGNITSPAGIGVTLTSPDGAVLPINNLKIGESGTLKTEGDFTFVIKDVSGSGESTWEAANTGGAEVENVALEGLNINVVTQLSVSGDIEGGEPGSQISLSPAAGTVVSPEGMVIPAGPLNESNPPESEYTAVLITGGATVSLALPGPGAVEDIFGAAANALSARSLTLTPGLASPFYVDNVWRIGFQDETGMPVEMPYEVELNFPAGLQTGNAVMEVPVVAIRNDGQVHYTLGAPYPGELLTSAGAVSNSAYNTVAYTGRGGDVAVFGCPTCGTNKVLICNVPPGNPENAKTKCIDKGSLINHLYNGSYCGPCEGSVAPGAANRPFNSQADIAGTEKSLQVYPNPASGHLYLRFDTEASSVRYILLTALDGRTVREQVAGAGELSSVIDVEGLPAGLYILRARNGEGSQWLKVVVE